MLAPVLAATRHLRTSSRLGVLVAVLVVPSLAATWSFFSVMSDGVTFAQDEQAGVQVVRPALAGAVAAVQGQPVDLSAIAAAVEANPSLDMAEALDAARSAVQTADLAVPSGRRAAVSALAGLVEVAGNNSRLVLDPDLVSFYAMDAQVVQLPRLLLAAASAGDNTASATSLLAARAVQSDRLDNAAQAVRADITTATNAPGGSGLSKGLAGLVAASETAHALAKTLTATPEVPIESLTPQIAALAAEVDVHGATQALDDLLAERSMSHSSKRDLTLGLTLASLLFAIWLAAGVWWRTRRDVALSVAGVTALAAHDLAPRLLPDGKDELGDLGRAVEQARREVLDQDATISAAADQREEEQRAHFREQRLAEQQARQRAQELVSDAADRVAAEIELVVGQVGEVSNSGAGIHSSVEQVDAVARGMVERTKEADVRVTALGDSLRRVASIAALINTVADQTKLLALNATIEAVRAGEAGRGFSVVANEVKELAAATARSTEEISSTIAELERDATAVGSAIAGMARAVDEVDGANGQLTGVASEQAELVAALRITLDDTLRRVRTMSDLADELERRDSPRVPASGDGVLVAGHQEYVVPLRDLSETGLRCVAPSGTDLQEGAQVQVRWTLEGFAVSAAAVVVRSEATGQIGLHFSNVNEDLRARLRSYVAQMLSA